MSNKWTFYQEGMTEEHLGYISQIIRSGRGATVAQQINANYSHGGGYAPMNAFTFNPVSKSIKYPGDDAMLPWATTHIDGEDVYLYEYAWLCIVQPNGEFAVTRMD